MLGTVCFRFCARGTQCPAMATILSTCHSPIAQSIQITHRQATFISLCRSLSWPRQYSATYAGDNGADVTKRPCHTSSCVEEGGEVSCATIWHGLLPSHHPTILDQNTGSPLKTTSPYIQFGSVPYDSLLGSETSIFGWPPAQPSEVKLKRTSSSCLPHVSAKSFGGIAMSTGLVDGSWNATWDIRPARWLHGSHSAWLLFGVCTCFSAISGVHPSSILMNTEHATVQSGKTDVNLLPTVHAIEEKKVLTDYTVIGIPGDGRCLFRAVAYGACLRNGESAPNEDSQRELADDLRLKVVDELVKRRTDCEWFIEGQFDNYVNKMREHYVWGGEPELLMASHVIKMPIAVHMFDRSSGGIISIAEYGCEYGSENPIRLLYHGCGHYDLIQVPGSGMQAKL